MKKHHVAYIIFTVVICVAVGWKFLYFNNTIPKYESVKVVRGIVSNIVSVSGHIEPVTRINLSFPTGGHIVSILADEGFFIKKGKPIAMLDSSILKSSVLEAEAKVDKEKSVLNKILSPIRNEEYVVKETAVKNAESTVFRTEESARLAIDNAFMYADDAIHEEADELFEQSKTSNPDVGVTFTYSTTKYILQADSDMKTLLNSERLQVETVLSRMKSLVGNKNIITEDAIVETDKSLQIIDNFLSNLATMVNKYNQSNTYDQTVYESFQTSVATARTEISTARTEISTAYTKFNESKSSLAVAESNLDLAVAGSSKYDIKIQEASIDSALAMLNTAKQRVEDTILYAPKDGVLSRLNFKIGDTISPYESVAELITNGTFEVEAYVPEADIASVKSGDKVKITFDAFERDNFFDGVVMRVALSESIRDGVPTYKTTIKLLNLESKNVMLKPGMTADIDIMADAKKNVLYIPTRSIIRDGKREYIRYFDGDVLKEKNIKTGLRGSNGTTEIKDGLKDGEEIVLYLDES